MEKFESEKKLNIKKDNEAEIQPPEFEIEEFEKARESFENLTKELVPALKDHKYDLIIGDDASGRIPTLVIGRLMKEIYREDKAKSPEILFLAGKERTTNEEKEELDNYLQKIIKEKKINPEKTKVLLVSEYISEGKHAANFIDVFKRAGLSCDIATLLIHDSSDNHKNSRKLGGTKMYIGEHRDDTTDENCEKLRFWAWPGLSGVRKEYVGIFAVRSLFRDNASFFQARKEVKKMTSYLKQIYDQEKEKIEKQNSV